MREVNRVHVEDTSQVGEARRVAASMGRDWGLDAIRVEHVSIVVTELATNLVNHAGGGMLIIRALHHPYPAGIEILSLDKGAGIRNVGESLRDGYSTKGSSGAGLGAIGRLSSQFDIYSKPDRGTVVLSIISMQGPHSSPPLGLAEVGAVSLPVATEDVCGDTWTLHQSGERALIMVADGLGHGQYAAEASQSAAAIFAAYSGAGPHEIIVRMHAALRITRGAAAAVAEINWGRRSVRYAGVGNISGRIYSSEAYRTMVSHNGTVGMHANKVEEFTYPWPDDGLLIMHSDGIATHWNLDDYPGLQGRNASLLAGVLARDHMRVRDDNTIVVIKETRRPP